MAIVARKTDFVACKRTTKAQNRVCSFHSLRSRVGKLATYVIVNLVLAQQTGLSHTWTRKPRGNVFTQRVTYHTMGTNCAPLVADSFLFCCVRDSMLSLSDNNQAQLLLKHFTLPQDI